MPFKNFHACRLREPGDFEENSFRSTKRGDVTLIVGKLKGKTSMAAQSIRYPVNSYTEGEARAACKIEGGAFEPAEPGELESKAQNITLTANEFATLKAGGEIETEKKTNNDELSTERLEAVEIFEAGTWRDSRGRTLTVSHADLDEMVANSRRLSHVKPFLKLMHLSENEHMRVAAKPSLGWLTNFRRVGAKLVVDITDVPRKVAQLIKARAYKRISAEIFREFVDEASGQRFKNVVSAAGLLGAVHPAVTTLKDVMALYGLTDSEKENTLDDMLVFYESTLENNTKEGESMDKEAVEKLIADALTKQRADSNAALCAALGIKDGDDPLAAIAKLQKEKESAESKSTAFEQRRHDDEVEAIVKKYKTLGKLLPKSEHVVRHMLTGDLDEMIEVTDSAGKTAKVTRRDWVTSYLDDMPKFANANMDESGEESDPLATYKTSAVPVDVARWATEKNYEIDSESVEQNTKLFAYAAEHKCSYNDAVVAMYNVDLEVKPGKGGE